MKKIFTCLMLAVAIQAQAQIILSESFNYPAGILGGNGNWLQSSPVTTGATLVNTTGLSYVGYPSAGAAGGCAQYVPNVGVGDIVANTFVNIADSFYCAFLMKITANPTTTTNQPYCVTFSGGDFFTHAARLMLYQGSSTNKVKVGVRKGGGGNPDVYASTEFDLNTTVLLVMKFKQGTAVNDDEVKLYINPSLTAEPNTADAMQGAGVPDFAGTGVDRMTIRNNGGTSTPDGFIDEIKIAKKWSDIFTSTIPNFISINEKSNLNIAPNPASASITISNIKANDYTIRLFNTLGENMLTKKGKTERTTIAINHLAKGIYVVQIEANESVLATQKFEKN
jgi:trimeric autotransporter adhesin